MTANPPHPDPPARALYMLPLTTRLVPPNWLWTILTGGYMPLGTECNLINTHLHEQGLVKGDCEYDLIQDRS